MNYLEPHREDFRYSATSLVPLAMSSKSNFVSPVPTAPIRWGSVPWALIARMP